MTKLSRMLILERSVVGGLLSLVPIPFVDDLLSTRVRRVLLEDLARNRQTAVPEQVLSRLARRRSRPIVSGAVGGLLRKIFGRAAAPLWALQRLEEAFYVYGLGLLFDYHLASGAPPFDEPTAEALLSAIETAIARTRPDVSTLRELLRGRWPHGTANVNARLLASFEESWGAGKTLS